MKSTYSCIGASMAMALFAFSAQAQSSNVVGNNSDWFVFEETEPNKQCWSVSSPKETLNTDTAGRPKAVRRGDIMLFVSYAPAAGVDGQVSFAGGYTFASGSDVTMEISGNSYSLFTDGETAWAKTPQDDSQIIAAMKRGAEVTLTGRSSRDTVTKDTFSLMGFTASVDDASRRCAQ